MSVATEARRRQPPVPAPKGARRSDRKRREPSEHGALLAVYGLSGGAGATTLAYLVALAGARQLDGPVLVADTGGPSGGLAALAGVEAPRSLSELASHVATGRPLTDGIYASGPAGLRVLATGPQFTSNSTSADLARILDDAREAHRLTVIDCGTLGRDVERTTATAATHLAWVMPATEFGVHCGEQLLQAAPPMADKELLVARRDERQSKASLKQLRRIAAERHATLVLVPHVSGLEHGASRRALQEAQVAIHAILGVTLR